MSDRILTHAPHKLEPWAGHPRGTRGYRRLLLAMFFAGIATFAQLYSPQAVLAEVSQSLNTSLASASLLVSIATLGVAVGVIPWAGIADRIGRVRTMGIAVIAATSVGLLTPLAPTLPLLLAGRFLEGCMIAGVPAVAMAYLNEEIHHAHAVRAAGTYVAGTAIGGLLGRLISGPVAAVWGWHAGIMVVALMCASAAAVFLILAPAQRRFTPASRRNTPPELRNLSQLRRQLRQPRQVLLFIQGGLLMGGFVALYNYVGLLLRAEPFALPTTLVSSIFLVYLVGSWASLRAGALAARYGRRPILVGTFALMSAGTCLTLIPLLIPALLGLILATIGFFGGHAIASGWVSSALTTGRAQASSMYTLAYYAGGSLFGWVGGLLFDLWGWIGTAAMVSGLGVIGIFCALLMSEALHPTRTQSTYPDKHQTQPLKPAHLPAQ